MYNFFQVNYIIIQYAIDFPKNALIFVGKLNQVTLNLSEMAKQEVLDLMKSSKTASEWNANLEKVKASLGGYPDYWYSEVILSGLMDKTLGQGASQIKFVSISR